MEENQHYIQEKAREEEEDDDEKFEFNAVILENTNSLY